MITMSERKEGFPSNFGDEYNLKPTREEENYFYTCQEEDEGPKVLATMRNMFAETKSDEYELVYHNVSESERIQMLNLIPSQIPAQIPQAPPTNVTRVIVPRLQPTAQPRPTPIRHIIQNFQNSPIPQNSGNFQTHQYFQKFQNPSSISPNPPPPGPADVAEEEEEEDHEEDDFVEDCLQNRIVHHCPECSKKYTSERRLKHHIQVHKNADAYKCPKCGYCYQSPDSLRRHWKKTPNCDEIPPRTQSADLAP
ncbi:hypothetical protein L5515_002626 [Caenorhabditis briggsae]|uniref:C2H2-type domain-containing protein n=2 Tax=Caenorhabditis briggsae TaxID=6238 RepID=A0AAE9E854_CAEBR|nr:hypothetical protein L5515_002626 [Caenorhabditis briggsae]